MTTNQPHRKKLKVELYEKNGKTSSFIYAEIDDKGDLVVSGQDVGEAPFEIWGDSDYEYWLRVVTENKDRVLNALIEHCNQVGASVPSVSRNKDKALLALLKQVYGGHSSAFEQFRRFCKRKGIPTEFSSYV